MLPTIASRCQHVRFDPLAAGGDRGAACDGVEPERARACARLALGDAALAARLASEEGEALRAAAEAFVRSALAGETASAAVAGAARGGARGRRRARASRPSERSGTSSSCSRQGAQTPRARRRAKRSRRVERRARTETLDLGLRLAELWLRDVLCVREGAAELVHAVDRRERAGAGRAASATAARAARGDRAGRRHAPAASR